MEVLWDDVIGDWDTLSKKEKEKYSEFLSKKRTLDDFEQGLSIPSKLVPKNIKGGVILVDSLFTMR